MRLVISDIHARETSAFPEEYSEKSKGVWKLQNDVADGKIAGNWSDVFIAQHRRVLSDPRGVSYPIEDIGLRDSLCIYNLASFSNSEAVISRAVVTFISVKIATLLSPLSTLPK